MILDLLENKFTLFYPGQGVLNSVEYLVNAKHRHTRRKNLYFKKQNKPVNEMENLS